MLFRSLPGEVRFGFFRGVVVLGAALLIAVALWYIIKKTRFGKIVRAGVDDRDMVSALGINVQLIFGLAFALGAALAGFGGVLGGTMISLAPGQDTAFLLNSLIVVIIGVIGVAMQQVFLRWNQGQDLRQALITIALSVIIADQMLAYFGGISKDIKTPSDWPTSITLPGEVRFGFFRGVVVLGAALLIAVALGLRSEERRVGKECRSRWSPYH